jgi:DNA-binding GntR family transcriptional regulator
MLIAKIGQNPLLVNALSYVLNQLRRMLFLDLKNINAEEISKDHQEIVRIIKRKDIDRAKELIKEHIKASQDRVFVYRMF